VIMQLEKHMLEEDVIIPVYFAYETEELLEMYNSMEQTLSQQKARSAAEGRLDLRLLFYGFSKKS
ncbi:hypothetical protein TNCV_3921181, partial [Trichonephila clavipes]